MLVTRGEQQARISLYPTATHSICASYALAGVEPVEMADNNISHPRLHLLEILHLLHLLSAPWMVIFVLMQLNFLAKKSETEKLTSFQHLLKFK